MFVLLLDAVLTRGSAQQIDQFRRLLTDVADTHPPKEAVIVRSWLARLSVYQQQGIH